MKYYNTITQISVGMTDDNPVYGDCVRVSLDDECGGMFLVFEQHGVTETNKVKISLDEWSNICQAVNMLTAQPLVK